MESMTLNDMLRRAAWRQPEQTFIYWSDRKRSVTYAQGEAISDQVAGALAGLGVRKGDRVAIFALNGLDYVLAMARIWKLGAISAHISVLQKDHLDYFIKDSTPKVLIYTGDMHPVIEHLRAQSPGIEHYICFDGPKDFALSWSEHDPLVALGNTLNEVIDSLRQMIGQIRAAAEHLNSASSEILAATTQQASGASEQSAAITQTTTAFLLYHATLISVLYQRSMLRINIFLRSLD